MSVPPFVSLPSRQAPARGRARRGHRPRPRAVGAQTFPQGARPGGRRPRLRGPILRDIHIPRVEAAHARGGPRGGPVDRARRGGGGGTRRAGTRRDDRTRRDHERFRRAGRRSREDARRAANDRRPAHADRRSVSPRVRAGPHGCRPGRARRLELLRDGRGAIRREQMAPRGRRGPVRGVPLPGRRARAAEPRGSLGRVVVVVAAAAPLPAASALAALHAAPAGDDSFAAHPNEVSGVFHAFHQLLRFELGVDAAAADAGAGWWRCDKSAFLDLQSVYGASEDETNAARTGEHPHDSGSIDVAFVMRRADLASRLAGDLGGSGSATAAQALLALFAKNHNLLAARVAEKMKKDDESLAPSSADSVFQVARHANCAAFRAVVLKDYLPFMRSGQHLEHVPEDPPGAETSAAEAPSSNGAARRVRVGGARPADARRGIHGPARDVDNVDKRSRDECGRGAGECLGPAVRPGRAPVPAGGMAPSEAAARARARRRHVHAQRLPRGARLGALGRLGRDDRRGGGASRALAGSVRRERGRRRAVHRVHVRAERGGPGRVPHGNGARDGGEDAARARLRRRVFQRRVSVGHRAAPRRRRRSLGRTPHSRVCWRNTRAWPWPARARSRWARSR